MAMNRNSFFLFCSSSKEYSCPFCSEYVAGDRTKPKQHILTYGSLIISRSTKALGKPNHLSSKSYGIKLIF